MCGHRADARFKASKGLKNIISKQLWGSLLSPLLNFEGQKLLLRERRGHPPAQHPFASEHSSWRCALGPVPLGSVLLGNLDSLGGIWGHHIRGLTDHRSWDCSLSQACRWAQIPVSGRNTRENCLLDLKVPLPSEQLSISLKYFAHFLAFASPLPHLPPLKIG